MILCVQLLYDNLFTIYKMYWCMITNTETFSFHRLTDLAYSHLTCWYWTVSRCAVLQGEDIVVVIGMLHCNGVARWLLSGVDPLKFISSQSKT